MKEPSAATAYGNNSQHRPTPSTPQSGSNIKRLKNWDPPAWRYRAGDWRFFCEIDEKQRIVFVTAADHRKEAYR
jgi:mRNA-degrading endonuclease RelE of RelBE toxin-antitoxin system